MESTGATELLFALQEEGSVIALSEGWAELMGVELDVLRKTPWQEFVHPEDVSMVRQWIDDVLSKRPTAAARARVRTSDGNYRFFEVAALCAHAPEGDLFFGSARRLTVDSDEAAGTLEVGEIVLDSRARTVSAAGQPLELTVSEFELLQLLIGQRGTVLHTDEIAREIWGYQSAGSANFLQAHVSRLRRKLRDANVENPITTVRGVGYVVR